MGNVVPVDCSFKAVRNVPLLSVCCAKMGTISMMANASAVEA
jgi:hypothetical protein